MLSVSIVVPVRNAARTLPDCLAALNRLNPRPQEVILVDNGSTDRSLQLLHAFAESRAAESTRVLEERRPGPGAARNAGIRVLRGELIAFTDADCCPDPDWLHHVAEPFADPAVGVVAGRVVGAKSTSIVELFSALYTLQSSDRPVRRRRWTPWGGGYPTANMAVRRLLLQKLGGFDEDMRTGEDHDLCARIYADGAELAYNPAARVSHYHRTAVTGMLRQAFGFGRAHAKLLRRHAGRGLWMDLPRWPVSWSNWPIGVWIDLASADKKMVAILLLGILYDPLFVLLPAYGIWLVVTMQRRAKEVAGPISLITAISLAGLLVLKSATMTTGRWWGSIRYGALCF